MSWVSNVFGTGVYADRDGFLKHPKLPRFRQLVYPAILLPGLSVIASLLVAPDTAQAQVAASCSGFSDSVAANGNGFQSTNLVEVNDGDTITGNITAPPGAQVDIFFLAGQDSVTGSGQFFININSTGGSSTGTVDFNFTNLSGGQMASATVGCTPGGTTTGTSTTTGTGSTPTAPMSTASSGSSADGIADGVDENLEDLFPETEDGDLFGKYGIGNPFEDEEDEEQTEEEEQDNGLACSSCQAQLRSLNDRLLSANRQIAQMKDLKSKILAGDESTLVGEGLNIDKFRNEHPEFAKLKSQLGAVTAAQERLAGWIRSNPGLAQLTGLSAGARGPTGDDRTGVQDYYEIANEGLGALQQRAQASSDKTNEELNSVANSTVGGTLSAGTGIARILVGDLTGVFQTVSGTVSVISGAIEAEAARNNATTAKFIEQRANDGAQRISDLTDAHRALTETEAKVFADADAAQKEAIRQRLNKLNFDTFQAEKQRDRLASQVKAKSSECNRICSGSNSYASTSISDQSSPFGSIFTSAYAESNRFSARFDLRQYRRRIFAQSGARGPLGQRQDGSPFLSPILSDEKLNIFGSSDVTISQDSRPGGQDGVAFSLSGGVSYMIRPKVNIGAALAFANSNSDSLTNEVDANTFSIAGFAQTKLPQDIVLEFATSYSRSFIDSVNNPLTAPVTADFQAFAFSNQLKASRSFKVDRFSLTPSAGLSFIHTERDAFVASDGSATANAITNSLIYNIGGSVGTSFELEGSGITLSPGLSLSGFGSATEDSSIGLSVGTGLAIKSAAGLSGNLGFGFSRLSAGQRSFAISGNITMPLGR